VPKVIVTKSESQTAKNTSLALNTTVTTTTKRTVNSPYGEQTTLTTVIETRPNEHTSTTYTKSETYGFYPGAHVEIPLKPLDTGAAKTESQVAKNSVAEDPIIEIE
jgi:hypothetical protein